MSSSTLCVSGHRWLAFLVSSVCLALLCYSTAAAKPVSSTSIFCSETEGNPYTLYFLMTSTANTKGFLDGGQGIWQLDGLPYDAAYINFCNIATECGNGTAVAYACLIPSADSEDTEPVSLCGDPPQVQFINPLAPQLGVTFTCEGTMKGEGFNGIVRSYIRVQRHRVHYLIIRSL
jgi:hypothetical protein